MVERDREVVEEVWRMEMGDDEAMIESHRNTGDGSFGAVRELVANNSSERAGIQRLEPADKPKQQPMFALVVN